MAEAANDERGASGEAVDYSRPVGWWCPVCHMQWAEYPNTLIRQHQHAIIPRYLPIPEGQRPPAASEVEDAEVVTLNVSDLACYASGWRSTFTEAVDEINYIVTGSTE